MEESERFLKVCLMEFHDTTRYDPNNLFLFPQDQKHISPFLKFALEELFHG